MSNKINTFILLLCLFTMQAYAQSAKLLSATAFQEQLVHSGEAAQLIDVRTESEFKAGHLKDALNFTINKPAFEAQLAKLDKNAPIYVYCKGGGRSAEAVKQMQAMGFHDIVELKGGLLSWEQQNLPLAQVIRKDKDNAFTAGDFELMLKAHDLVLVDFYAEWCIPCQKMKPALAKLKVLYADQISLERVDVDQAKDLAKAQKIEGLPVLVIYAKGKEIKRVSGYQSEEDIVKLIESVQ